DALATADRWDVLDGFERAGVTLQFCDGFFEPVELEQCPFSFSVKKRIHRLDAEGISFDGSGEGVVTPCYEGSLLAGELVDHFGQLVNDTNAINVEKPFDFARTVNERFIELCAVEFELALIVQAYAEPFERADASAATE